MNSPSPQPPATLTLPKHSLQRSCPEQALGRPQEHSPRCLSPPRSSPGLSMFIHSGLPRSSAPGHFSKPAPHPCPAGMAAPNSGLPHRKCSEVFARDNCALKLLLLGLFGLGEESLKLELSREQLGTESRGCTLQPGFATSTGFILPLGACLLLTKQWFNSSPAQARLDLGKC